ncbi:MAG: AMP-binding protein [Deltaproteobacteria bacterium]|nr:AMP-binding protein [Deltaproteobacteria bacterium]
MTVYTSSRPDPVVPDQSVTEYILAGAAARGDRPALIEGATGRVITYAELNARIHSLAGGLAARGVGPGTTWALLAPNLPEYVIAFHGLALCGATTTTLNPTYGPEEVATQLRDSGATAIITVGLFLETANEAAKHSDVQEVIVIGPGEGTPFSSLFGEPLPAQVPVDLKDHVVVLPYSSGTTGFPKGVMLTHHNLVANLEQFFGHMSLKDDEVVFAVLPFFHIYGMQILMNAMMRSGATVVTVPRFDLVQMLELTQSHGITRLFLVPPIVLALAKHPLIDQYDLSSVRQIFSGAAPLGGDVAEAAAKRLGCSMAQGYGMTELSPVTHSIAEGEYRAGSVGTLVAGTEARLIDPETGTDAFRGERGEIWVRGPQIMKGYLNNPEATAATVDAQGWLHTGDVGVIDDDGHTFIVDRLKELIKYKGFQVPPAELEALLLAEPRIVDAAVIGVPDDEAGELPKAFVVRAPGADIDAAGVQAFVAEHVASYKQVRIVEFVESIPKSASGKILRRELRAR